MCLYNITLWLHLYASHDPGARRLVVTARAVRVVDHDERHGRAQLGDAGLGGPRAPLTPGHDLHVRGRHVICCINLWIGY